MFRVPSVTRVFTIIIWGQGWTGHRYITQKHRNQLTDQKYRTYGSFGSSNFKSINQEFQILLNCFGNFDKEEFQTHPLSIKHFANYYDIILMYLKLVTF